MITMKPQIKVLMEKNSCKTLKQLSLKLGISYTSMRNRSCGRTNINSKGKYKSVKIPACFDEKIAELIGIILGDGNLNRNQLRIFGNVRERKYYKYIQHLIWNIFDIGTRISPHMVPNGIKIEVNSVKVCEHLASLGLKFGDKIKNKVVIPEWIFENNEFLRSCIRGLFDTDGSFFPSSNNTEYNILWKMGSSSPLPKDIRKALLELGFHPTNIFGNGRKVALCRKKEIIRFFNEIKPQNNVHLSRYASSSINN